MSCSKFERSFRDEDVERLIKTIERAVFSGEALMQKVKELKKKIREWEEYVAYLCFQVTALADEIDKHHERATKAKLGGAVAGVAGAGVGAGAAAVGAGVAVVAPPAAVIAVPVAAVGGGIAGAGSAVAGGAAIVDAAIQRFKQKKAQKMLKRAEEMKDLIAKCQQQLQKALAEYEESVNRIIRMSTSQRNYLNSLKSIEDTKAFLHLLMNWISDGSGKKKVGELCKTLLGILSNVDEIRRLLSLSSKSVSLAGVGGAVGVVVAVAGAPLQFVNLTIAVIDLQKGSKTELAAKLREHVEMFREERDEINKALYK